LQEIKSDALPYEIAVTIVDAADDLLKEASPFLLRKATLFD
jgi:hypothetical protein